MNADLHHGYKVIHHAAVHEVPTFEEAARLVADLYPDEVRPKVRVSPTRERHFTRGEANLLADQAAAIITRRLRRRR